jgi:hypothetical protein
VSLSITLAGSDGDNVYEGDCTHNLGKMANEAGLYEPLWRAKENGITTAEQLAIPLHAGLDVLLTDPLKFRKLNPSNGWGDYDGFVRFVVDLLIACRENPTFTVRVSDR